MMSCCKSGAVCAWVFECASVNSNLKGAVDQRLVQVDDHADLARVL